MKNKLILALSGNDIFSGGGLHADLATYTVHGLHGFVAVTCLTAMTDKGFEVLPTDEQVFAQQLSSIKDVPFSAIKLVVTNGCHCRSGSGVHQKASGHTSRVRSCPSLQGNPRCGSVGSPR